MMRRTTTAEFLLRLLIPLILIGISFLLEIWPIVSREMVTLFRWLGVGILTLIIVLQVLQWVFDFIADNFHKTEERRNREISGSSKK